MNNQHEIAMVRHWNSIAKNSQAKTVKSFRKYAEQADLWAKQAQVKANSTERKESMRMTRQDNAEEVFVCLLAVTFFVTLGITIVEQPVATITSWIGAGLFVLIGVAYTWQECRYRKSYQQQLNARLDEIVEGGLDVTV